MVLFMNPLRLCERHDLASNADVLSSADLKSATTSWRASRRIMPTTFPQGCLGAYYPECNPLILVWHHARGSKVPASKGVPVSIATGGTVVETR